MIDKQDNCIKDCFLCNIMEQCSHQCIRRTFYAVMIGVSPIIICLVFIGLARLILNRLEIAYYRRQKVSDRHSSIVNSQSGRLALSYTPVSNAELQRIIQGEYQTRQSYDLSTTSNNVTTRKTPRFIKSILPRREPASPSASILANLVIRRDAIDASPLTGIIAPIETPLQPTFSVINEQEKRRPSLITIKRESVETTTLAGRNNSNRNSPSMNELVEFEPISYDPLMASTKTMTTTTTVVVEEFLEFHSVSSLPCALSLLNNVAENDNDVNSEINNDTNDS